MFFLPPIDSHEIVSTWCDQGRTSTRRRTWRWIPASGGTPNTEATPAARGISTPPLRTTAGSPRRSGTRGLGESTRPAAVGSFLPVGHFCLWGQPSKPCCLPVNGGFVRYLLLLGICDGFLKFLWSFFWKVDGWKSFCHLSSAVLFSFIFSLLYLLPSSSFRINLSCLLAVVFLCPSSQTLSTHPF